MQKAHAPTKQYSHLSLVEKHFQQEVPYLQPAELAQLFQQFEEWSIHNRYEMPSLPLNGTFMIGPTSPTRFDLISDVQTFTSLKTRYHTQFYIRNKDKNLSDLNYHPITQRLWRLRTLLVELSHKYDLSWCGLYLLKRNIHSIEWALVKECSVGDALRCIIPVTPEWVQENNCAWTAHYERMCYVPNLSQLVFSLIFVLLNS